MSQRTVAEVNHDIAKIDPGDFAAFCHRWNIAIASGSAESWHALEQWGIRRIERCHHSEDRKLVVGKGALVREYPIG